MASKSLPLRFIITHCNRLSARFRFLCFGDHVCAPKPLPHLVSLYEQLPPDIARTTASRTELFSSYRALGTSGQLDLVPDWIQWVEARGGPLAVYLLEVRTADPFQAPRGAEWLELTASFRLSGVERQLLRSAYDHFLR